MKLKIGKKKRVYLMVVLSDKVHAFDFVAKKKCKATSFSSTWDEESMSKDSFIRAVGFMLEDTIRDMQNADKSLRISLEISKK